MNLRSVTLHESIKGPGNKEMRDAWVSCGGPRGVDIEIDKKMFPAGVVIKPGTDNASKDMVLIPWNNIKCAVYDEAWLEQQAGEALESRAAKAKRETEAEA